MRKLFIKQAIFVPVFYFGFIFISGFLANDYSHTGQHASELGINSSHTARILFGTGIWLTSLSLFVSGLGILINFKRKFLLTSILILLFGVTFVFGAIYPIGSPWHGFYGFGLFVMLLPFVFLYETGDSIKSKTLHRISIIAGFLMFLYLWSMVARLDPAEYRGLTQRLFGLTVFGWISYVSYHLGKIVRN